MVGQLSGELLGLGSVLGVYIPDQCVIQHVLRCKFVIRNIHLLLNSTHTHLSTGSTDETIMCEYILPLMYVLVLCMPCQCSVAAPLGTYTTPHTV